MNIRWELYKEANGIESDDDVRGANYIIWVTNKLRDYRSMHEIKGYFTVKQNAEFDEWLRNEVQGV